jgi:hypothetical protein
LPGREEIAMRDDPPGPKRRSLQTNSSEAIMADQTSQPGSGDVADERGEVTPREIPGHAVIAPDAGIDATATHEPSKPISMSAGSQAQPD